MKIAILLSGGVDSSLAAALLKEQGHEVVAFYLKIWLEDELAWLGQCPWSEDLEFAQKLCTQLDIPLQQVNLQREYWQTVVDYTISQARAGFTPNPDVLCNSRIKFGCFLAHIDASFDKIATGHYAQIQQVGSHFELRCSPDRIKDQTYFLAHLNQAQLARCMFPVGDLTKAQVRQMAQARDLPAKDRHDSQGLCFLGKIKFSDFLRFHLSERPGNFVEVETGKIIGQHAGFWFFTIGQRKGMGLSGGPWYVVKKDAGNNIVYISRNYYAADKLRDTVFLQQFAWQTKPTDLNNLEVKLRHGPERYLCSLELQSDVGKIRLSGQDQGIAPGQFAVFYQQDLCLGCAVISLPVV